MQVGRRSVGVAVATLVVALTTACGITYHPGSPSSSPSEVSSAGSPARMSVSVPTVEPTARFDLTSRLPVGQATAPAPQAVASGPAADAPAPAAPAPAAPAPAASTPEASAPTVHDKLQPGDHGDDVKALQERLNTLGYLGGTPDGSYGDLTQQAVYAVQKAAGLDRDGVAGPATRKAVADGVRPTARSSGDAVEIDLAKQLLLVVRGGQLVATFNTSTGSGVAYSEVIDGKTYTGDAQTYRGTFSVYREVDGPDKAPLGTLYRSKYFDGGIAVHGAPFVPPYPASHGCARLSNFAIDLIWANGWMPMGSTVVVY